MKGSGIVLYKMLEDGVPKIEEYLEQNITEGQIIGFDGRTMDAFFGKELEKTLAKKNATFVYDRDIAASLWQDRPARPVSKLWIVSEDNCGMSVSDKLAKVRFQLFCWVFLIYQFCPILNQLIEQITNICT